MADLKLLALRRNLAAAKARGDDERAGRIEARIESLTPKPAPVPVEEPPKPRGRPRKAVADAADAPGLSGSSATFAAMFDPSPEAD